MPLKKQQILDQLVQTVKLKEAGFHRDYTRVCEHAELMSQFITGENLDKLMIRFNPRESPLMFEQRTRITNHIVKPMSARVMKPVQKINKVNPSVDDIHYDGEDKEKNAETLRDAIKNFWGGKSLDDYLGDKFLNYQGLDPNAWMLQLFDTFDHRFEKPKPYIVEVTSAQAINFQFANNEIQQLTIRSAIKYTTKNKDDKDKPVEKDGFEYQIYGFMDAIRFVQVDEGAYTFLVDEKIERKSVVNPKQGEATTADFIRFDKERVFMILYYEHKAGEVPAWRIGALKDPFTNYRTCVSILDNAVPYLKKSIKIVSEGDITTTLHCFPQKFVYVPECMGFQGDSCISGWNSLNQKCKACEGTGHSKTHTTGQDVIEITLPDMKKQIVPFDLSKLVHYAELPIEVAKFQKEIIDELDPKVWGSVYNSDFINTPTPGKTATSEMIDLDNIYDTLQPIATHYSTSRCTSVRITAAYLGINKGLKVNYKFPKDFKFKSVKMLLADLDTTNTAQAPSFVKQDIYDDLANNLYSDRPLMMERYKGRQRFDPFEGKTPAEVQYLIGNSRVTEYSTTLYAESKRIFQQLEDEAAEKKKSFWEDFTDQEHQEAVDKKVKEFMDEIAKAEQAKMAIQFDPKNGDPTSPDPGGAPPEPKSGDPKPEPANPPPAE